MATRTKKYQIDKKIILVLLPVLISSFVIGGLGIGLRISDRINFFEPIIIPLVLSMLGLIISIILISRILERVSVINKS